MLDPTENAFLRDLRDGPQVEVEAGAPGTGRGRSRLLLEGLLGGVYRVHAYLAVEAIDDAGERQFAGDGGIVEAGAEGIRIVLREAPAGDD